jgi:sugar lactone lactonase YvrE
MSQAGIGGFEQVARGIYLEGLAVDYERNVVWYSDPVAGGIFGVYPDGKTQSFDLDRQWTGGIMLNADGAVLSSGPGGIRWNNPETGKSGWLLSEIDGKPINGVNEMMPDGAGGFYFGTNDIEMIIAGQPTRPTALYRLTLDRKVIPLADGIGFTNGIMLSPDGKRLYCNDTFASTYVFDVQPDLTLANKRLLVEKEDCDGMALDVEGNLWITGYQSSALTRARPDGTLLAPYQTPGGGVSQVRFGGADMRDVYITTVPGDAGETLKVGGVLTEKNSILCRGRSDVPGLPIAKARFDLG